ncbi:MAG: PaaI family thioesterase [Betaproteobacteria bacterium]|nr:PaaI family thioesterase [Betaproteobacteria bacterium]
MKPDTEALKREWLAAAQGIRDQVMSPDVLPVEAMKECSGLELFQKMLRGELPPPPIALTLDFTLVEAEKGRVVFQGHPARAHYNPIGSVHGGYHATLLDSCVACAVQSTLAAGQGYTTIELKVNYLRALTDDVGPVRAEGKIIHVGRQIGTAEGRLYDAAGRLYAHATTTCLIFSL